LVVWMRAALAAESSKFGSSLAMSLVLRWSMWALSAVRLHHARRLRARLSCSSASSSLSLSYEVHSGSPLPISVPSSRLLAC
jgi:hypothetical protein